MTHPGRVFSREQLLDAVWGHDVYVEARTVDVHIRRLRKALNADGAADVVRTVRSAGYALDHPATLVRIPRSEPGKTWPIARRFGSADRCRGAGRSRASAARNTAAVASSGAATQTSTPEAQARTAAGPTRSIAKIASETGSGDSDRVRRKFVQQRSFARAPKRAPAATTALSQSGSRLP